MLTEGEPIPEKARRPIRDMERRFSTCQGYNMVRRYGWTIAMTKEDMHCSLGVLVLGFDKPLPIYTQGNLCEGMYTATARWARGPKQPSIGPSRAATGRS